MEEQDMAGAKVNTRATWWGVGQWAGFPIDLCTEK